MKPTLLLPILGFWASFLGTASAISRLLIPSGPFHSFKTEPDFEAFKVDTKFITNDTSRLGKGYYFLAPYKFAPEKDWGIQIVDQDGHLIWYGKDRTYDSPSYYSQSQDVRVCDYLGIKGEHLCFSESGGYNRILNNRYEPAVEDYRAIGSMPTPNGHEFNMMEGGETFVRAVYVNKPVDLREKGGPEDGWVSDGCFQEIDAKTRKELFSWCFLDHYNMSQSANSLADTGDKTGIGHKWHVWDFCHLNAVDKNEEGDYLVSMRHMSNIIKVAGLRNANGYKPGEPMWRLGGRLSSFELRPEFNFSVQHFGRFIESHGKRSVVAVFNNDYFRTNSLAKGGSSVVMININEDTMEASLNRIYTHPSNTMSPAQGGYMILPNGNIVIGWGTLSHYSEFTHDGELLYHAEFSKGPAINYRTPKQEWKGYPTWQPKLLAYCKSCAMDSSDKRSPLVAYASYNGATELASWRFSVSFNRTGGDWHEVGVFPKTGFETMVRLSTEEILAKGSFAPHVLAEALDANGTVLSNVTAKTFVAKPKARKNKNCDALGCYTKFSYAAEHSHASYCRIQTYSETQSFWPFAMFVMALEAASLTLHFFWDSTTTGL